MRRFPSGAVRQPLHDRAALVKQEQVERGARKLSRPGISYDEAGAAVAVLLEERTNAVERLQGGRAAPRAGRDTFPDGTVPVIAND
jgi:hypothetical protein